MGQIENGDVIGMVVILALVGIGIAFMAFSAWIWWRIVSRTGHSGWLSLLMWVPLANFVLLLILAFGDWPIYRELDDLRRRVAGT